MRSLAERDLGLSSISDSSGTSTFLFIGVQGRFTLWTKLSRSSLVFILNLVSRFFFGLPLVDSSPPSHRSESRSTFWKWLLAIRSSNEWNEITASRPPGLRNLSKIAQFKPGTWSFWQITNTNLCTWLIPLYNSFNSLLTNILSAWKTFVAALVGLFSESNLLLQIQMWKSEF